MEVLQFQSELNSMIALYLERQPKRILEIGSWDGGTLKVWIDNAPPGATIVAIDLMHRNAMNYDKWARPDVSLMLRAGSSADQAGRDFIRCNGPYDWAFIDGSHDEPEVRSDVEACLESVRPGGLLLLHDVVPGKLNVEKPAPQLLFEELSVDHETWRYVSDERVWISGEMHDWAHGIGVVQL
jgi:predicted O-methyltransferase YrrM